MSPIKRGQRGFTVFGLDPRGLTRTRHFGGMVDVLARGTQSVIGGIHPVTGQPFGWQGERTILNTPVAELPIIAPDIEDQIAAALAPWLNRVPRPAPVCLPLRSCALSENERERQRRYAEAVIATDLGTLAAMAPNTGRNVATFRLICRVGRWAHHGIIQKDQLVADVLDACERNGLVRDDGRKAVLATIASGLAKSAGDMLPDLGARHG